jgi:alpha-amylase/alpha-mannosidase (GH57 family)
MIYWAPLLHIYQPPTQEIDVLKRIDEECYKPLFKMLARNPEIKITLNINGVLLDLLNDFGLNDTIKMLVDLVNKGIVEIVGTAKYHPLLPLIQEKEVIRQIQLNEETNKKYFGDKWQHGGFFPPELAISDNVLKIIAYEGYQWVIASGIACPDSWPYDKINSTEDNLLVFYRDDIVSNEISFNKITAEQFIERIKEMYETESDYIITAMDGETFGHHIRNYEVEFLEKALKLANSDEEIEVVLISDLIDCFPVKGILNL